MLSKPQDPSEFTSSGCLSLSLQNYLPISTAMEATEYKYSVKSINVFADKSHGWDGHSDVPSSSVYGRGDGKVQPDNINIKVWERTK